MNIQSSVADTDNDTKENARADSPSYADEQKKLRHEIKKALDSDEDEEEFGGIFRRREKTKEEKVEIRSYLKGSKF